MNVFHYPARRGGYEDYDHSDQEPYVYDQCCRSCMYYSGRRCRCTDTDAPYGLLKKQTDWCESWRGGGRGLSGQRSRGRGW